MSFINSYGKFAKSVRSLEDLALLALRLIIAYGFFQASSSKWGDIPKTIDLFESIGIPFASFSVSLVAIVETVGVLCLVAGIFTRVICIPLMITMLVAIFSVHIGNGFSAANNGFEIPLYYFAILFYLFTRGPGRVSFDIILLEKN